MRKLSSNANANRQRQLQLLRRVAAIANFRTDTKVPLGQIGPHLDIKAFGGGSRFVNASAPTYEGGSELSYDLNTLRALQLIEMRWLKEGQDEYGGRVVSNPAIAISEEGLARVELLEDEERDHHWKKTKTAAWLLYVPICAFIVNFLAPAVTPLMTDWIKAWLSAHPTQHVGPPTTKENHVNSRGN